MALAVAAAAFGAHATGFCSLAAARLRPAPPSAASGAAAVQADADIGVGALRPLGGLLVGSGLVLAAVGRPARAARRAGKGFGDEKSNASLKEGLLNGFSSPSAPDLSDVWTAPAEPVEQPKVPLPGPLKPPAAPATYKALKKIRLRVAPSTFADVMTSHEIEKGTVFRAIEASEEDDGTMFLKSTPEYSNGWLMMKGVAGKWAGRSVVKRVAGSMAAQKGTAMLEISEVERVEDLNDAATKEEAAGPSADPVLALLEDPKIRATFEKQGISVETLKNNPEFLEAVAKRLYGDEDVSS